jgi:hypothetical protein
VHESHGRANLIAFNYLLEKGAYRYQPEEGRYFVNMEMAPGAVEGLAREILLIQALGDYDRAKAFVDRYTRMSAELEGALDSLKDIPVDIEPRFEIEERLSD